jgi:peptidoglycan/xylan/chitin deacetylase (PgdA/CDA1 family)
VSARAALRALGRRRRVVVGLVLLVGSGVMIESATSADAPIAGPRLQLSPMHAGDPNNAIVAVRGGPDRIALTFDDGPLPAVTGRVLAFLRRNAIRATFFVVGRRLERHPELIRDELRAGHEVQTHTWSHELLPPRSTSEIRDDIVRGARSLRRVSGRTPRYFRPPHGFFDPRVSSVVAATGLRTVGWDVAIDRLALGRDPKLAARMLLEQVKPGSILLAHDAPNGAERAIATLTLALPELRRRGLSFVTVSELLSSVDGQPPAIASSSPPSVPTSSVPSAASAG